MANTADVERGCRHASLSARDSLDNWSVSHHWEGVDMALDVLLDRTVVHDACQVKAALARGCAVDLRSPINHSTPLHKACSMTKECHPELAAVKALTAAGADVEARNINGFTPLHLAASSSAPEVLLHPWVMRCISAPKWTPALILRRPCWRPAPISTPSMPATRRPLWWPGKVATRPWLTFDGLAATSNTGRGAWW